jgi:hypothetical protein
VRCHASPVSRANSAGRGGANLWLSRVGGTLLRSVWNGVRERYVTCIGDTEAGNLNAITREVSTMTGKEIMDKLSIYIPQRKMDEKPVERLMRLGQRRDRSVNYLVVEAIIQYLDREENKN